MTNNHNELVTDEYQALTPKQAAVLYGIWLIAYQGSALGATREAVARIAGITVENLARILTSINRTTKDKSYESLRLPDYKDGSEERGPRPVFYKIKWETFVTIPLTAELFVRLIDFEGANAGRIVCQKFISKMKKDLGFDENDIKKRIRWGASQNYVILSDDEKFIATDTRIQCEILYISRVAKHLVSK